MVRPTLDERTDGKIDELGLGGDVYRCEQSIQRLTTMRVDLAAQQGKVDRQIATLAHKGLSIPDLKRRLGLSYNGVKKTLERARPMADSAS